jgi:MYXO-CTERM domain-containing protein
VLSRLTFTLLMCLPLHQALAQDACDPNPCTSPPPDECDPDGVTLWTYPPEGGCTDLGGGIYNCGYTPMFTDCSAQGKICADGVCVDQAAPALSREGIVLLGGLLAVAAYWVVRRRREPA